MEQEAVPSVHVFLHLSAWPWLSKVDACSRVGSNLDGRRAEQGVGGGANGAFCVCVEFGRGGDGLEMGFMGKKSRCPSEEHFVLNDVLREGAAVLGVWVRWDQ